MPSTRRAPQAWQALSQHSITATSCMYVCRYAKEAPSLLCACHLSGVLLHTCLAFPAQWYREGQLREDLALHSSDVSHFVRRCSVTRAARRTRRCGRPALTTCAWAAGTLPAQCPCCPASTRGPQSSSCTSLQSPFLALAASSRPGPPSGATPTASTRWQVAMPCVSN